MKVSLSASHGGCLAAIELLRTCDVIYTTQVRNLDRLQAECPSSSVRPIPDAGADLMDFLKARHAGDEVIGFSELYAVRRAEEGRVSGMR